jgi:acetolactate synthase-1/2/3 large subunit
MKRSGAQIVWEAIVRAGADVVFGIPGGMNLPIFDALPKFQYPVHLVLTRHEQGASHMADGYARASGRVGVCMATSGPGATNLVTGLATAQMDSSPVVAITGQVASTSLGRDWFQEADVTGITMPVTKHNYLVTDISELPDVMAEAFYIAQTGRPGPVLVDICRDVQAAQTDAPLPDHMRLPGYKPNLAAAPREQVAAVAALINSARQPLIIVGQGVTISGAHAHVLELAEKADIPVASSLLGLSAFPQSHPLALGMGGMHGEAFTNNALQNCDVLVAIGARLDDRLTGVFATFAPKAKIVHLDIDRGELGKNLTIAHPLVGDARLTLEMLNPQVQAAQHTEWRQQIAAWRADTDSRDILAQEPEALVPPYVIRQLHEQANGAIVVTDVGQHQMWEAQYYPHDNPRTHITSGGLGTMGFALPAALGASFARPDGEVWTVAGDGGFQMTMCELATIVQEQKPVKIAIINNGYLGMVRQWQDILYDKRYSGTPLFSPDFAKLAAAYGIPGLVVTEKAAVAEAIRTARSTAGPFLLEFRVDPMAMVYPMVLPGKSNSEMLRRPMPENGADQAGK